jgi:outer membrane murein-binding lipoprotein Lpp
MRFSGAQFQVTVALALIALAIGCTSVDKSRQAASLAQDYASSDRKMVRSGDLIVTVDSPEEASPEVARLVKDAGGFVERSTETRESNVWLRCRVPAASLDQLMDAIADLGDEERRSVSVADVTEQYADLETRLRNNIALRERLQQLLQRASDVEDVLAIEKELNRIQSEIETMQAQFDRLKSEVELSALSINLQRKRILGPLGYVGYGFWWMFSKLFVVR